MKLIKVEVNKLFGIFNHNINIKNEGITIVIGENGLGKTAILEMIINFFQKKYHFFNNIDFESILFHFSDEYIWKIEKKEDYQFLITQYMENKKATKTYTLKSLSNDDLYELANRLTRASSLFSRVSSRKWRNNRTGMILSANEVVEYFKNSEMLNEHNNSNIYKYLNEDSGYYENSNSPDWFNSRINSIKINLIETQRLISLYDDSNKNHERNVENYSNELARIIRTSLTQSTELSSKLDRTYPNRLIERIHNSNNVKYDELKIQLTKLETKRELLDKVGLIVIDKDSNISDIKNIQDQDVLKEVLMLYVEDSFKKIEIFDDLSKKIELFLNIINKRFKHKKLYIDKELGFLLKSTIIKDKDVFKSIPVTKLSSGEQNELVLFYLLLFKTEANSLILIDEPEVSLHISWQNCFIEDLKEIINLNNLDVIIATHSPDIISENWDLTVQLEGIE